MPLSWKELGGFMSLLAYRVHFANSQSRTGHKELGREGVLF